VLTNCATEASIVNWESATELTDTVGSNGVLNGIRKGGKGGVLGWVSRCGDIGW
jgi:hypothetical protein